ncbi:MAG TPA: glycosyltransferase family 39 protein, partial [Solirubrobacteraceae bacterium]|nr:glycosyltransferase family 39 protein [Solirubrobacteraceae bacterium]
ATRALRVPRPELLGLLVLAGVLNLWALSRNGWANDYYSAAVRSMSSSWHNFLFASADPSGVMTVDKPPLALWVQALSVRVFGYHSLSMLVPQALMGVASVALVYDLVRRHFGRLGGFVGGLAFAITPITVAVSRHNNPDALLVLCCVAALWFALRALQDGRTRWLVGSGVAVGLAFETKMAVALMVVPGIVTAYLWVAPRGRARALSQLLAGGGAMALVGGAWPALVALTPAADRPWISGTSDNSIFSLIFGYNGVGRLDGQTGGPGGGAGGGPGGTLFGGSTGPLRLFNDALGGQDGWLLGFALVCAAGILIASRGRRSDPRTGWVLAVGGAFLTTAVVFSTAQGIFHPYYVSLLAPFAAALTGAGAAQLIRGGSSARVLAPFAIAAGVAGELMVLHEYPGQLTWLRPLLVLAGVLTAVALVTLGGKRTRLVGVAAVLAVLFVAPATWAVDTLGYATSGTFPAGGPASAGVGGPGGGPGGAGGPGRGFGGPGGGARGFRGGVPGGAPPAGSAGPGASQGAPPALFGPGGSAARGAQSRAGLGAGGAPGAAGAGRAGAGPGSPFGDSASITRIASYVRQHGGGTLAVSSQSSAAAAIISKQANVAGIGGFSGRESQVSIAWLAQEVSSGHIRWVLADQSGAGGMSLPGDTRTGATTAMAAVAKVCRQVTLPASTSTSGSTSTTAGSTFTSGSGSTSTTTGSRSTSGSAVATSGANSGSTSTLYDCQGLGDRLLSVS